jgi:hypothetical protein
MSGTRLVIQADDFGMCHAVNEGIERTFLEGVLTQTTAMPPCPWAEGYRASNLAVLCDPRVRERVEARHIRLVSVACLEPCAATACH